MKKSTWAITALLAIILLIFGGSCLRTYRDMTALEDRIEFNWTRVDDALQIRNELIPNLVNTAKGYASKEREVFDGVARARVGMSEARGIDDLSEASVAMKNALTELLAVVDGYPPLKADRDFNRLREKLDEAESRIAVECRNYNVSVQEYNACLEPFPNNIVAGVFGFVKNVVRFDTLDKAEKLLALDKDGEA